MANGKQYTADEAKQIGAQIGIDWQQIEVEEFCKRLAVEMEHGSHDPQTDVTHDDPLLTGKIAWARIKEYADYYTRWSGWRRRRNATGRSTKANVCGTDVARTTERPASVRSRYPLLCHAPLRYGVMPVLRLISFDEGWRRMLLLMN